MNNYVGLKFLLYDGHYLAVEVTRRQAEQIVEQWKGMDEDDLEEFAGGWDVPTSRGSASWFVRLADVQCLHTFDLQQPPEKAVVTPPWGASGLPLPTNPNPSYLPPGYTYKG